MKNIKGAKTETNERLSVVSMNFNLQLELRG